MGGFVGLVCNKVNAARNIRDSKDFTKNLDNFKL